MVTLTLENQTISEKEDEKQKIPKEVYIISQEIKIAKNLSCCDLKLREKQLKRLKKWLQIRSESSFEYTSDDLLRIWKGLFYCFWMSDKPLVQEELAEEFGKLVNCFKDLKTSLKFFNAFLKTMCAEWFGLDQWRLDKFLMLTRRMLRYTLFVIKKFDWPEESIQDFNFYVAESVLDNDVTGMIMHLVEIFMDELAKVSNGKISAAAVSEFTKPFIIYLAKQRDPKILGDVRNKIFYHLLRQSDRGRDYEEKFEAWKEMGFPDINFDDLEKIENEESEIDEVNEIESALDPRAGNVDVFIPMLPVECKIIIHIFEKILENEIANAKSKKFIIAILDKYKKFENGEFPLGIKKMPKAKLESFKPLLEKTTEALNKLDDELHGIDRDLKKVNKKKRRKILNSLNIEEADENNYDSMLKEAMSKFKKKKIEDAKSIQFSKHPKKRKVAMEWTEEEIETKKNKMFKNETKSSNHNLDKKLVSSSKTKTKKLNGDSNDIMKVSQENKKGGVKQIDAIKAIQSEWNKPLEEGEVEYFVSSSKIRLKEANKKLKDDHVNVNTDESDQNYVLNPYSKLNSLTPKKPKNSLLGKKMKKEKSLNMSLPEKKKVKIALAKNMIQKPSEYIRQIRNSPQVPYDADKKPTKSLLKPNQMPSPINPFYKKKIGLQLNETF